MNKKLIIFTVIGWVIYLFFGGYELFTIPSTFLNILGVAVLILLVYLTFKSIKTIKF